MFIADFAAQVALDPEFAVDQLADPQDLGIGQLADAPLLGDRELLADLPGTGPPDPEDVGQADEDPLLRRYVDAGNTRHG